MVIHMTLNLKPLLGRAIRFMSNYRTPAIDCSSKLRDMMMQKAVTIATQICHPREALCHVPMLHFQHFTFEKERRQGRENVEEGEIFFFFFVTDI